VNLTEDGDLMEETIGEPTAVGKSWQRGIPLERLRAVSRRFQAHDGPRCLGAFSKIKENIVAGWIAEERLLETPDAAVAFRWLRSRQTVSDFRGEPALEMPPGALSIERVAGTAVGISSAIESLAQGAPVIWRSWADHPEEIEASALLGLERSGTLIRASSEVLALRSRGASTVSLPLPRRDFVGIAPLAIPVDEGHLALAAGWPSIVESLWIDHYSSYNKRQSWHAVALRSFGGDPAFIEKPAEMSRRYQQEHPERLSWEIADTPLLDSLPGARALLGSLGCGIERARLMRLTTGGELSRHADITDRSAGTRLGAIARLHLPLITHESVRFTTWSIDDQPTTLHMAPGSWWYLDVRKPHMAENPSGFDRIHLVVDCIVDQALAERIEQAHP